MARGRTAGTMATRYRNGQAERIADELLVEEPLEIRLDDHLVATTMRTPGNDFELAAGSCHSDGLLVGAVITSIRYCGAERAVDTEFNVVSVSTGGVAPVPEPRLATTSSSCGLCGSRAIATLTDRLEPLPDVQFDPGLLGTVATNVVEHQQLFAATGGSHAAAAFDLQTGDISVVREDIGRHNAVDKVVGRLLLDGRLPARRPDMPPVGLWVSGRASFEMVQKAWAGGFGVLVSVSAASALAVDAARRANLTLIGFSRGESRTIYLP